MSLSGECLAFDDVLLVPGYSEVPSRTVVNTSVSVGQCKLMTPMISSPMDTVTEHEMAKAMGQNGGMGIVHRYMTPEKQAVMLSLIYEEMFRTGKYIPVAAAVGVSDSEKKRVSYLLKNTEHIDLICVDVANGFTPYVRDMISYIRDASKTKISIMAGNVATQDGFAFLAKAGADAVRVGIGSGSICSTRIVTGCGVPVLSSIIDCNSFKKDNPEFSNVSIIADGGIRYPADLVKSVAAGADAIIGGRIYAGTDETPGDVIDGYKVYRGMASKEAQESWVGMKEGVSPEGVETRMPAKGSVKDVIDHFTGGLKASLTFHNAYKIGGLRRNARFIKITDAGVGESHAFGTRV